MRTHMVLSRMRALPPAWQSVLLLVWVVPLVQAQTTPPVTITPFSEAGVTISPYDPTTSLAFAQLVRDNPGVARVAPFSAILTNASGRNIVALTLIWTWFDPSGRAVTHTFRQDSLFFVKSLVAPVGSRLLLTPGNNWSETAIERTGSVGVGDDQTGEAAEKFESSPMVVFELDALVFEDGLVLGQDKSQTAYYIRSRKDAAAVISRDTLQMLDRGEDPTDLLTEFARLIESRSDWTGMWYERIATMLLRTHSPLQQRGLAEQLSKIPEVSHLHQNP